MLILRGSPSPSDNAKDACVRGMNNHKFAVRPSVPVKRSGVRNSKSSQTSVNAPSSRETDESKRYEFETRVAQKCIRFDECAVQGRQLIIVSAVRGPIMDAGIRPGQQLTAISDTNRDTVWALDDQASLRFVYLCLQMRIPNTITLAFKDPILPPDMASSQALPAKADSADASGQQQYLDDVLSSMSSDDEQPPRPPPLPPAEAALQRAAQDAESRSKERIKARKVYLEQVGTRNDAPFIAAVLAAFLLPALIILAVAFGSGYIDSLTKAMYRS